MHQMYTVFCYANIFTLHTSVKTALWKSRLKMLNYGVKGVEKYVENVESVKQTAFHKNKLPLQKKQNYTNIHIFVRMYKRLSYTDSL